MLPPRTSLPAVSIPALSPKSHEGEKPWEGENMKRIKRDMSILSALRQDARTNLTSMSRATRIPVSTLFDKIKGLKKTGLVRKYTALLRFEKLGYSAKAMILLSANKKDRANLHKLLTGCSNVNSLYKINSGWDYIAEVVFPGMKEVEAFVEEIEEKVKLKKKMILYILDEIKRESFLATQLDAKLPPVRKEN